MGSVGASNNNGASSVQYSVDNPLDISNGEFTIDGKTLSSSNDKVQFMNDLGKDARATIYPGQSFVLKTSDMGEGNQLMVSNAQIGKVLTASGDYNYLNLPNEMLVYSSALTPQVQKALDRVEKAGYKYDIEYNGSLGVYRRYKKQ